MKNMLKISMLCAGLLAVTTGALLAQGEAAPAVPDFAAPPAAAEAAPAAAAAPTDADTTLAANPDEKQAPAKKKDSTSFFAVLTGSGKLGIILWLALVGSGVAAIYFIFDCSILFKAQKMIPQTLVDKVQSAMNEGDVLKALKACESEPGPLANILSAGFSHVEEGYDVIQEGISTAADIETERVMQRINWISVCGAISPSLGLLGTVQGMIMAFEGLATGSPDVAALALAISQALWTTAGGLVVSIPAVTIFYVVRNNANRLILRMQALTFELIKDLRNVEVVE